MFDKQQTHKYVRKANKSRTLRSIANNLPLLYKLIRNLIFNLVNDTCGKNPNKSCNVHIDIQKGFLFTNRYTES